MNKVTVAKAELEAAVARNRAGHRDMFAEATEGYRAQQIAALEEDVARLKRGRRLNGFRYLPVPEDHTKDYDRILLMIRMHQADVIDISQEDFAKYVMDDWEWRRAFLGTSANYSVKAKVALDAEGDE